MKLDRTARRILLYSVVIVAALAYSAWTNYRLRPIEVVIRAPDTVSVDGQALADPRLLRGELERLYLERPKARILIQPESQVRAEVLLQAMNEARAAGFADVQMHGVGSLP